MTVEQVFKCSTIDEAMDLLNLYKQNVKVIAGGTDLIIALENEKISPKVLIDISKINEMKKIEEKGNKISIGAGVTFTQVINHPLFKSNLIGFKKACELVGSPQIRNKGTIGGNIAHNSPAADSIPPLLCLDSKLKIASSNSKREVLLEDYYIDREKNGLKEDEIITSIEFEKINEEAILTFAKLGLRKALAISRITASAIIELNDDNLVENAKIASGSIGRYPMREYEVETYLQGKKLDEKLIDEASTVLQLSMDKRLKGRATLPYKRKAIESILKEVLNERLLLIGVKA